MTALPTLSHQLAERLEPLRTIARGAGGLVLACRDRASGRTVVLKHSGGDQRGDATLNARFLREGRLLGRLDHPGVLRVLDAGEDRGARWLLLEHLEGPTIEERVIESGPVPVREALDIAASLAHALASVHALGILHRDVKPGNVMLVAGRGPVLIDFGIARTLLDSQALTATGQLVCTPAYTAPEIVVGADAHPGSDLYGAALVLHYMLLGRATFSRKAAHASLSAQVNDAPEPPPRTPPAVQALLDRWLAKVVADRPSSDAAVFAAELERAR